MPLEKKHCLKKATSSQRGVFLASSVWSLEEQDKEAISGVGLIEITFKNLMLYPLRLKYKVEAQGDNIRWETQAITNERLSLIGSGSEHKYTRIFEVDDNAQSRQQQINVIVITELFNAQRSIQFEVSLPFNIKATSKLLYRREDFEQICSIIVPDLDSVNTELFEYFAKHPENLHDLDWRKFEELLDAIFKNLGYRTELGPGRNDAGVDLRIFQRDDIGEILTLVQAKKYDPKNPIDLQPVAALSAIVNQENAQRGLFVTTSRYLPVAKRFAEKEARRLILADSSDIAKWCKKIVTKLR